MHLFKASKLFPVYTNIRLKNIDLSLFRLCNYTRLSSIQLVDETATFETIEIIDLIKI